jgi:hypothetical protein
VFIKPSSPRLVEAAAESSGVGAGRFFGVAAVGFAKSLFSRSRFDGGGREDIVEERCSYI